MKKVILDALKAKFSGVSETILNRIATELAKTARTDEEANEAADSVSFQEIIDREADYRGSKISQTAIENYEKKHSLKEGKPVTQEGGAGSQKSNPKSEEGKSEEGGSDLAATIAAAIRTAVEPLTAQISTLQKEKAEDSFNKQLNEAIGSATDKYKQRVLRDSKHLKFDSPEAQNEWLETIKAEAAEDAADNAAQGASFGRPKFGNKGSSKGEVPASVMEGIKAANPEKGAQPF